MSRPHCWTDPVMYAPETFGVRHPDCDWCRDGAASCRAYGPDMKPPTEFPAECDGCARKLRDDGIRGSTITPHPHRVGRRSDPARPATAQRPFSGLTR